MEKSAKSTLTADVPRRQKLAEALKRNMARRKVARTSRAVVAEDETADTQLASTAGDAS